MIQNSSKEIAPQCAASASCCRSSSPRWRPDRTARPRDRFKPGRRSRARRPQAWLLPDPAQRDPSDRASSSVAAEGGSATPRPMPAAARPISGKPGLRCELAPIRMAVACKPHCMRNRPPSPVRFPCSALKPLQGAGRRTGAPNRALRKRGLGSSVLSSSQRQTGRPVSGDSDQRQTSGGMRLRCDVEGRALRRLSLAGAFTHRAGRPGGSILNVASLLNIAALLLRLSRQRRERNGWSARCDHSRSRGCRRRGRSQDVAATRRRSSACAAREGTAHRTFVRVAVRVDQAVARTRPTQPLFAHIGRAPTQVKSSVIMRGRLRCVHPPVRAAPRP